jgi:hypothetical protein
MQPDAKNCFACIAHVLMRDALTKNKKICSVCGNTYATRGAI